LWYAVAGTLLMVVVLLVLGVHRVRSVRSKRPLLPRAWWMQGHVWLSLLSAALILCHSAGRPGGLWRARYQLETVLLWVFVLTNVTGLVGLVVQHVLPGLVLRRRTVRDLPAPRAAEVPGGQVEDMCECWRKQAEEHLSALGSELPGRQAELKELAAVHLLPLLRPLPASWLLRPAWRRANEALGRLRNGASTGRVEPRLRALRDVMADRRRLLYQETVRELLKGWILVHVPLATASVVLVVPHAIFSLYF
jgi:hypothetical protein